jgi:hypothetical protein
MLIAFSGGPEVANKANAANTANRGKYQKTPKNFFGLLKATSASRAWRTNFRGLQGVRVKD